MAAGRSKESRAEEVEIRGMVQDEAITFLKKKHLWADSRGASLHAAASLVRPRQRAPLRIRAQASISAICAREGLRPF